MPQNKKSECIRGTYKDILYPYSIHIFFKADSIQYLSTGWAGRAQSRLMVCRLVRDCCSTSDAHATVAEILAVSVVLRDNLAEDVQLFGGDLNGMGENSPDDGFGIGRSGERSLVGDEILLTKGREERSNMEVLGHFCFLSSLSGRSNRIDEGLVLVVLLTLLDEHSDHSQSIVLSESIREAAVGGVVEDEVHLSTEWFSIESVLGSTASILTPMGVELLQFEGCRKMTGGEERSAVVSYLYLPSTGRARNRLAISHYVVDLH
ncbi:hypothetical protein PFISCL1PPCAC_24461 [Pristionchus fissidentatus]|uniref:Uncharacterized protein n=1 Tax=Pristionchus fissidentatus TaxID=1538716 RepID=A0AAV5WR40_9BILA|nr:hypothetical protein PFISCL1PPCAC_24461 [Pristionchus fissidentatus]